MDKDWLCVFVMLSLTEEIHGNPIWIRGWLNIDENFRRPGDHINPHLAEDSAVLRSPPMHYQAQQSYQLVKTLTVP